MTKGYKGKNTKFDDADGESDKELLDYIYGGYKQDVAAEEAKEIDELKQTASTDFLRFYGFLRRWFVKAGNFINRTTSFAGKKAVKYSAAGLALILLAVLILPALSGDEESEVNDTLGASEEVVRADILSSPSAQPDDANAGISESEGAIFKDSIEGTEIRVIQQLYPPDINNDNNGLKSLALSIPKKTVINPYQTEKGLIYVVDRENDAQTVVLSHSGLLIFITSEGLIDGEKWVQYVNQLN